MDLQGASIMILGGSGLVGHAVARRILDRRPRQIVLVALTEREVRETAQALAPHAGDATIVSEHGNVYLPAELAHADRTAVFEDAANRRRLIADVFGDLTDTVLDRSQLVQLLSKYRPDAVVDCINTATAFAYMDVYRGSRELAAAAAGGGAIDPAAIEKLLLTMPIPQLTRHVQILKEGLRRAGTRAYVKIGTAGTGGMGFNIPYTHSEERPSRTLMTKSAVAGAHTLLLFLLGRTPDAPATIEVKPTAAIGWREIRHGPVRRGGRPIDLYDCPEPLPLAGAFAADTGWVSLDKALESVFIDMGENGVFAREEFATITALGQMEFITPEEIADTVLFEIEGHPTGRDVVASLDASTSGPTYRAGLLREAAMRRLAVLAGTSGARSVAFEMLGPPRLTKLLFEAYLWSRLVPNVAALAEADAADLSARADALVAREADLRAEIVSVGLPIVCADGASLYRGPHVVVPPAEGDALAAAPRGWVDLREANCALWIARARRIVEQAEERRAGPQGTGSDQPWDAIQPDEAVSPSRLATWIFRVEDQGERIKR